MTLPMSVLPWGYPLLIVLSPVSLIPMASRSLAPIYRCGRARGAVSGKREQHSRGLAALWCNFGGSRPVALVRSDSLILFDLRICP